MDTSTVKLRQFESPSAWFDNESDAVGKVTSTITVTNNADEVKASCGVIQASEIRSVVLNDVLADTGATTLCLPADVIATLGLEYMEEVGLETAAGFSRARLFRHAHLFVAGREDVFSCVELPVGRAALLGVIPLERLGIELDLKNQRLRLLERNEGSSYITAYVVESL